MNVEIPDKLYFKIGEVSKLAGVPPHVLRYWESEFSAIRPKRANSKQRLYRRTDVELILKLKELLHEQRYTIAGARKFLSDEGVPHDESLHEHPVKPPARHPDPNGVPATLDRIKRELRALQLLLQGKDR
ncbi:MerR family transcriptional regulator [Desulfoprunum benzoelyticum]|uniref:DNA-binding transcriptional MerR regulator n=1 Tax=Desulfoprunum benzoelyticum TaxID=1506996 RepID=A0A840V584_9BACT|nr:MerR family transcriptional regulator [Desulfoprunum benzoelyticum]MBB5349070.1 DNA-binding transcriptional MerR regulator [Desulfoprunum benzoelyticum]MBM9530559.1 MerR family transcriptional regulator [Desulfoprunum benzoelyticum]